MYQDFLTITNLYHQPAAYLNLQNFNGIQKKKKLCITNSLFKKKELLLNFKWNGIFKNDVIIFLIAFLFIFENNFGLEILKD